MADFIDKLRPADNPRGGIRWVRRSNLHLTLRFLGDCVEAPTLERLDPDAGPNRSGNALLHRRRSRYWRISQHDPAAGGVGGARERGVDRAGCQYRARRNRVGADAGTPHLFTPSDDRAGQRAQWMERDACVNRGRCGARIRPQSCTSDDSLPSILSPDSATYQRLARYPFAGSAWARWVGKMGLRNSTDPAIYRGKRETFQRFH